MNEEIVFGQEVISKLLSFMGNKRKNIRKKHICREFVLMQNLFSKIKTWGRFFVVFSLWFFLFGMFG